MQDYLGRRILLENVSSYLGYRASVMTEWEFFGAVAERADCLILLDINNIHVSAVNHGFDPLDYLDGVPAHRVQQHHLAGHSDLGDYLIDTHDANIIGNAYRMRLLEALADAYPSVHTLLGDERFQALGLAYVDAWPSQHFSIRWFGHRLSRFLAESPDYRHTPVLAEMAAFEWALRDAFDAADTPVLDLDALRRIEPEAWAGLALRFHPSLRRLDLTWNVPQLWSAIDSGDPPIAPACHDYPVGWVIWRRGLRTYFRSLDVDEADALDAGANGETFGVICDGLTEWVDEINAPQRAAGMVSRWAEDGLIASVVPNAGTRFRNAKTSGCRI